MKENSFLPETIRFFPLKHHISTGNAEYEKYFRILADKDVDVKTRIHGILLEKFFTIASRYPFKSYITLGEHHTRIVTFVITDTTLNQEQIQDHREKLTELFSEFKIPDFECEYIVITQNQDIPS